MDSNNDPPRADTYKERLAHRTARRRHAFDAFVQGHGLSVRSQRLLRSVVDGYRGERLCALMGTGSLARLEADFEAQAQTSVYDAALLILEQAVGISTAARAPHLRVVR